MRALVERALACGLIARNIAPRSIDDSRLGESHLPDANRQAVAPMRDAAALVHASRRAFPRARGPPARSADDARMRIAPEARMRIAPDARLHSAERARSLGPRRSASRGEVEGEALAGVPQRAGGLAALASAPRAQLSPRGPSNPPDDPSGRIDARGGGCRGRSATLRPPRPSASHHISPSRDDDARDAGTNGARAANVNAERLPSRPAARLVSSPRGCLAASGNNALRASNFPAPGEHGEHGDGRGGVVVGGRLASRQRDVADDAVEGLPARAATPTPRVPASHCRARNGRSIAHAVLHAAAAPSRPRTGRRLPLRETMYARGSGRARSHSEPPQAGAADAGVNYDADARDRAANCRAMIRLAPTQALLASTLVRIYSALLERHAGDDDFCGELEERLFSIATECEWRRDVLDRALPAVARFARGSMTVSRRRALTQPPRTAAAPRTASQPERDVRGAVRDSESGSDPADPATRRGCATTSSAHAESSQGGSTRRPQARARGARRGGRGRAPGRARERSCSGSASSSSSSASFSDRAPRARTRGAGRGRRGGVHFCARRGTETSENGAASLTSSGRPTTRGRGSARARGRNSRPSRVTRAACRPRASGSSDGSEVRHPLPKRRAAESKGSHLPSGASCSSAANVEMPPAPSAAHVTRMLPTREQQVDILLRCSVTVSCDCETPLTIGTMLHSLPRSKDQLWSKHPDQQCPGRKKVEGGLLSSSQTAFVWTCDVCRSKFCHHIETPIRCAGCQWAACPLCLLGYPEW